MKKRIVRHIELVASIATMIVSIAAPNLLWRMGFDWTSRWLISVVIMALILGSMLSIVYHRRQVVRRKTIDQVREMLHDRIRNPLSIVWLYAQMLSNKDSLHNVRIREAIKTIDAELENLSEDALQAWQINYATLNEELTSTRPPAEDAA